MATLTFTVDSHLLRELGERLVGKPYIALAELIKNSYDADANKVTVVLDPGSDRIEVNDDGHGMDIQEFKDFWMRIGSIHKDKQVFSRGFKRRMTGSKGVGRLAVQFLAEGMKMTTMSDKNPSTRLKASVLWKDAVEAGDLTKARVQYEIEEISGKSEHGTSIVLTGLRQKWDEDQIKGLTKEIWFLTPPFRTLHGIPDKKKFTVVLETPSKEFKEVFGRGMTAILDIWHARIVGKAEQGKVRMTLEFADEDVEKYGYEVPDCELDSTEFEIRVYSLKHKQPRGIQVDVAREYMNEWGGVHVYDNEFHLPYYGRPENDWLGIEMDHSHRRTASRFLPEGLHAPDGLSYLPTNSRLLGVSKVDTRNNPNLSISITRDRLQEGKAFEDLRWILRYSIDLFAMREATRAAKSKRSKRRTEKPVKTLTRLHSSISKLREYAPGSTLDAVEADLEEAIKDVQDEERSVVAKLGILGSFASAGVATVAYRHELGQQFASLDQLIERLRGMKFADKTVEHQLIGVTNDLETWLKRARSTNALFENLGTPENVKEKNRFNALSLISDMKAWLEPMARGIPIQTKDLDPDLLLPSGSIAAWGTVFQNAIFNAFNALIDSRSKIIDVKSRSVGGHVEILVQDTGEGVDIATSEELFEPFVRKVKISEERRRLGYGGTGLGLTIVRVVADALGCHVRFVEPDPGFNTAFSISWVESS